MVSSDSLVDEVRVKIRCCQKEGVTSRLELP